MSITKQFEEVFYLGFEDLGLENKLNPTDIVMSSLIFLRITPENLIFYYLNSSDQIIMPGTYLNLFIGIDRLLGDQLRNPETDLETFLFLGTRLGRMIYGGNKENIDNLLSSMVKIGSTSLRLHLKRKFDYNLEPLTLKNIINTLER